MFAVIAAVFFFLAAFNVHWGDLNLVWFALGFLAVHFAYDIGLPIPARGRYARQDPQRT